MRWLDRYVTESEPQAPGLRGRSRQALIADDDPELTSYLRIEERELQAGAYLWRSYADPLMAPGAFRGYGG